MSDEFVQGGDVPEDYVDPTGKWTNVPAGGVISDPTGEGTSEVPGVIDMYDDVDLPGELEDFDSADLDYDENGNSIMPGDWDFTDAEIQRMELDLPVPAWGGEHLKMATQVEIDAFNIWRREAGFEDPDVTEEDYLTNEELLERKKRGTEMVGELVVELTTSGFLPKQEEQPEMFLAMVKPEVLAGVSIANDFSDVMGKYMAATKTEEDMVEVLPEATPEELEAWEASLVAMTAAIPATPKVLELDAERVPAKKIEGRLIPDGEIHTIYHLRYAEHKSYQKIKNDLLARTGIQVSIDLVRSIVLGEIYKDLVDTSTYAAEIKEARAKSGMRGSAS